MYFIKRLTGVVLLCLITLFLVAQQTNYARLVNPFIGTGGHGHTYPGASMPFGMMQLSPDTRLEGWDGCSGYHYSDSLIYGFSHTHLSGTGIADYCDVLAMPFTGKVQWNNTDYRSPFSHTKEKAHAGYYEVLLEKHQIHAALTTSYRSGMHQYTFAPGETTGKILIDLEHRDDVLESSLEIVSAYEVRGLRRSKSWAQDQSVYFYIRFEQPILESGIALNDTLTKEKRSVVGKNVKAWFGFQLPADRQVRMKIGISGVSMINAQRNLEAEIPHWEFSRVQQDAESAWNRELGKIEVTGGRPDDQVIFYTALYHAILAPNLYTDVNGEYRGTDLKIHKATGFENYTVFSLWDTYRALHPLMAIINQKRTADWINTFLAQYKQGGMLPVWELSGNETFCMIGYHSVPVIVDAYQKGIRGFDEQLALEAMLSYARSERFGLKSYREKGFIANNEDHESVSKTLEYAYDDWCIAQLAQWLGRKDVYDEFRIRSKNYLNLYSPADQFFRGKVYGFWYAPFFPSEVNNFYTEGNAWHYAFSAQHDMHHFMNLFGSRSNFAAHLNRMFTTTESLSGREQADVTGLIGQYAHGNEPSHHIAYLFNYAGQPQSTQELVHRIRKDFYKNAPDGLIGNEDCGQMSAWYVLSAMGFYQVTPGSGFYELGTPLFDRVVIHLENGKDFVIKAKRNHPDHFYVTGATLNGKVHTAAYLDHTAVEAGGTFEFELGDAATTGWGTGASDLPVTQVSDSGFLPVPYFEMETYKSAKEQYVKLCHLYKDASLYYRVHDTSKGNGGFMLYTKPFRVDHTTTVSVYAQRNSVSSPVVQQLFYRLPQDKTISVTSKVHPMYTGGGMATLVDGITGTTNWKTGDWHSYYNQDFVAVVDLLKVKKVQYLGVHVLQEVSPWILFPQEVTFEASEDGIRFVPVTVVKNRVSNDERTASVQLLGTEVDIKARYIRVHAKSGGPLPAWHESAGSPSHLFIDEVIVK